MERIDVAAENHIGGFDFTAENRMERFVLAPENPMGAFDVAAENQMG